jgi:hypothetical protein
MFQFNRYKDVISLEEKELALRFGNTKSDAGFTIKSEEKSLYTYKIKSRQVSNFCIPEYAIKKVHEPNSLSTKLVTKKLIHTIKHEDLIDLDKYSPKFKRIIHNINSHPDQLSVVYSQFVGGEGGVLFSLVLEAVDKYVYWRDSLVNAVENETVNAYDLEFGDEKDDDNKNNKSNKNNNENHVVDKKKGGVHKHQRTYALINGNVPYHEREIILRTFNNKKNINGKYISVLIISESGAEGLTFKNVRSIHITEPYWNYARIEQVNARGARFGSHSDLPKNEQNIQPYIYVSIFPKNHKVDNSDTTTDQDLLKLSIDNKKLITNFEMSIIEASVDCSINKNNLDSELKKELMCHLCIPDNKPLYTNDISYDIKINNCRPLETTSVKATKINFNGEEYFYTRNNADIRIYKYDNVIKNYVELEKNNPIYSDVVLSILK